MSQKIWKLSSVTRQVFEHVAWNSFIIQVTFSAAAAHCLLARTGFHSAHEMFLFEIFKTRNRGWGARATVAVKRGKVLGVYTGCVFLCTMIPSFFNKRHQFPTAVFCTSVAYPKGLELYRLILFVSLYRRRADARKLPPPLDAYTFDLDGDEHMQEDTQSTHEKYTVDSRCQGQYLYHLGLLELIVSNLL
jgi:hypothetical protein